MEHYSDEELLYLVRCGNEDAKEKLYQRYYFRDLGWLKPFKGYRYLGMGFDDLVQIGMINFWNALSTYRDDQNTSLCTYIKMVVMKRCYGEIVNKKEMKMSMQYRFVSLDEEINEEGTRYDEVVGDPHIVYQPEKIFTVRETTSEYLTEFEGAATSFEKEVMYYNCMGYSEQEISKILNISLKSVYNAMYRAHKKFNH